MSEPAQRITLLRLGKMRRTFVISGGPRVEIGETVALEDLDYIVIAVEDTEIITEIKFKPETPK